MSLGDPVRLKAAMRECAFRGCEIDKSGTMSFVNIARNGPEAQRTYVLSVRIAMDRQILGVFGQK